MLFGKKDAVDPDAFWKEYAEKIQETVLGKGLGRYIDGWEEYEFPLWGLVIVTSGGFRFHHFPHEGWLTALSRITTGGEPPKEKTIFIPRERIAEVEIKVEKNWLKKLISPSLPIYIVRFRKGLDDTVTELRVESEMKNGELTDAFSGLAAPYQAAGEQPATAG
jgi:hypothetical protein